MTQPSTDTDQWSFTQVADAYLSMHRLGNAPTVQELAESFPHLANQIKQQLPTMQLLEGAIGERFENRYPTVDTSQPIGGCHIIEEIGRGACGIVYRASQPELNREVAIKAIRLQSKTTKRFEVERHAMARLSHPNIVPVYAYTQVDEQAYLIMKLIDGFSFEQLLGGNCDHRGKFQLSELRTDWKRFAELGRDIAAGLQHAHENNLVHRDIKPGNLMLDRNGHVWIADFGLVKLLDISQSLSATGDLIGTPRYMSPEQLRGTCDARSDIYSLGLSLYELATGQKPRQFQQPSGGSSSGSATEVAVTSDVPPELLKIIEKASSIALEDRYQSAKEVKLVFERYLEGLVPDRRRGRRKPDEVFRREFRTKITIATLVAAVIGALSYFVFLKPNKAEVKTILSEVVAPMPERREFQLQDNESEAISRGIDAILTGIENGELTDEDITKVARRYRESRLSIAARTVRIAPLFLRSGLAEQDKARGVSLASKLARLIAFEQIDNDTASELIDAISNGRALSKDELNNFEISDERLLSWVDLVDAKIGAIEIVEKDLTEDVREIFSTLGQPSPQKKSKKKSKLRRRATVNKDTESKDKTNQTISITSEQREQIDETIKSLPQDLRKRALEELRRRSKE